MKLENKIDQEIQGWAEYHNVEFTHEAGQALTKLILSIEILEEKELMQKMQLLESFRQSVIDTDNYCTGDEEASDELKNLAELARSIIKELS